MAPPDAILGLNEAFKADSNPGKINLSVGLYQDAQGHTPILDCVKQAERRLVEAQTSKGYLAITGIAEYGRLVRQLVFGADQPLAADGRAVTLQAPGGTGACRIAGDFLAHKLGVRTIWCSKPTWANHMGIFKSAGLAIESYAYLADDGFSLDFDAMLDSLKGIPSGDAICLHACCHNPTGVDLTVDQWGEVAAVLAERGVIPVLDFAYQGFGDGLSEDAAGVAEICSKVEEVLICTSFSKNFGLYSERTGAMTLVAGSEDAAKTALSHAKICVRTNYSNPPEHGGAIVTAVLSDDALRAEWEVELAQMRDRINGMRHLFADTMKAKNAPGDFSFITRQRGMFSFSGLSAVQVDQLRKQHSIYIVGDGRVNVAGMTEANMDRLCDAIVAVL